MGRLMLKSLYFLIPNPYSLIPAIDGVRNPAALDLMKEEDNV